MLKKPEHGTSTKAESTRIILNIILNYFEFCSPFSILFSKDNMKLWQMFFGFFFFLHIVCVSGNIIQSVPNRDQATVLGRGYSVSRDAFHSMCFRTNRNTVEPTYDYDYVFHSMHSREEASKQLMDNFASGLALQWFNREIHAHSSETTSFVASEITVDKYHGSIAKHQAFSEDVSRILRRGDLFAFLQVCGPSYVHSVRKRAEFATLFYYTGGETMPSDALPNRLQLNINDPRRADLYNIGSAGSLKILIKGIGLGYVDGGRDMIPNNMKEYINVLSFALESMTDEETGVVTSMEIMYWSNSLQFVYESRFSSYSQRQECRSTDNIVVDCNTYAGEIAIRRPVGLNSSVRRMYFAANAEHIIFLEGRLKEEMNDVSFLRNCIGRLSTFTNYQKRFILTQKDGNTNANSLTGNRLMSVLYDNGNLLSAFMGNMNDFATNYYSRCIAALEEEDADIPGGVMFTTHWTNIPECADAICPLNGATYNYSTQMCEMPVDNSIKQAVNTAKLYCEPQIADPQPRRECYDRLEPNQALLQGQYLCSDHMKLGIDSHNAVSLIEREHLTVCERLEPPRDEELVLMLTEDGDLGLFDLQENISFLSTPVSSSHQYYVSSVSELTPLRILFSSEENIRSCTDVSDCHLEINMGSVRISDNYGSTLMHVTGHFSALDGFPSYEWYYNERSMSHINHQFCALAYEGGLAWFQNHEEYDSAEDFISTRSLTLIGYERNPFPDYTQLHDGQIYSSISDRVRWADSQPNNFGEDERLIAMQPSDTFTGAHDVQIAYYPALYKRIVVTATVPHLLYFGRSPTRLLQQCQGNCVNDDSCAGSLVCFTRGTSGGDVPGCTGIPHDDGTNYCMNRRDWNHLTEFVGRGFCTAEDGTSPTPHHITDLGLYGCRDRCMRRSDCIGYTTHPGQSDFACYFYTSPTNPPQLTIGTTTNEQSGMNCFKRVVEISPVVNLNYIGAAPSGELGQCEGNCAGDNNCADDLVCYTGRNFGGPVPGCNGNRHDDNTNYCMEEQDWSRLIVYVGRGFCTAEDGTWPTRHYRNNNGLYGCRNECMRRSNCIGYTTHPGREEFDCYWYSSGGLFTTVSRRPRCEYHENTVHAMCDGQSVYRWGGGMTSDHLGNCNYSVTYGGLSQSIGMCPQLTIGAGAVDNWYRGMECYKKIIEITPTININYIGATPSGELGPCEGNCNPNDNNCAGDLVCHTRGNFGGLVPGCDGNPHDDSTNYCMEEQEWIRITEFVAQGFCTAEDGTWPTRHYMKNNGLYGCRDECMRRSNCIGYTTYPGRNEFDCYWYSSGGLFSTDSLFPSCRLHEGTVHAMCGETSVYRWGGSQPWETHIGNCNYSSTYGANSQSIGRCPQKTIGAGAVDGWYSGMECYVVNRQLIGDY